METPLPKPNSSYPRMLFRSFRIHQWVKQSLLFVPVLTAHAFHDKGILFDTLVAFVCFGLCASAGYLWNDLRDAEHDRAHPTKRFRPIASGEMSKGSAAVWIFFLLSTGMIMGWMLGPQFAFVLAVYFAASFSYSLWWKKVVIWDAITLALLYTLRIIAGHKATGIAYSSWLFTFSLFIFLSLAFVKRYAELRRLSTEQGKAASGRGYFVEEMPIVAALGCASGCVAALVFVLYISSQQVLALYPSQLLLWFACPLIFYWIGRVWVLTHRGLVQEDPIIFALKDPMSYLILLGICGTMLAATWA